MRINRRRLFGVAGAVAAGAVIPAAASPEPEPKPIETRQCGEEVARVPSPREDWPDFVAICTFEKGHDGEHRAIFWNEKIPDTP